jgi:hypothetical protein
MMIPTIMFAVLIDCVGNEERLNNTTNSSGQTIHNDLQRMSYFYSCHLLLNLITLTPLSSHL